MTLKVCFENQTHKIAKNPTDYSTLVKKVVEIFGNQLPQNWTLQYLDSDDDKIMLNGQEDYKTLLEEEISESKKFVKIFIMPLEEKSLIKNKVSFAVEEKPATIIEDAESVYILEPQELVKEQEEMTKEKSEIIPEISQEEKVEITEEVIPQEKREVAEEGKLIVEKTKEELKQQKAEEKAEEKKRKIQEKKQKKVQKVMEKQAKKQKKFEDVIVDLLFEQLPTIASYNRDFILQEEDKSKSQKPVHRSVACDGCGVFPVVGIRYKCLECADFDFCEKCEATKQHAHPFIKFKKPQGERVDFERRSPRTSPVHNHFELLRPQQREQRDVPHPFWFNHGGHRINTEQFRQRRSQPGFTTFYC